jgi:hypothetical protein
VLSVSGVLPFGPGLLHGPLLSVLPVSR